MWPVLAGVDLWAVSSGIRHNNSREEEGRLSNLHDRLVDPKGWKVLEAPEQVWREGCKPTDDEHRFTCGVKATSRTKRGLFLVLFFHIFTMQWKT